MIRVTVTDKLRSIKTDLLDLQKFIDRPDIEIIHIGSTGDLIIHNKFNEKLPREDFDASTIHKHCGSELCYIKNCIETIDGILNNVKTMRVK